MEGQPGGLGLSQAAAERALGGGQICGHYTRLKAFAKNLPSASFWDMTARMRPFFQGRVHTRSKEQRVDVDIPLPREDRPSRNGPGFSSPISARDSGSRMGTGEAITPTNVTNVTSFLRSAQAPDLPKRSANGRLDTNEELVLKMDSVTQVNSEDGRFPTSASLQDALLGPALHGGGTPKATATASSMAFDESIAEERVGSNGATAQQLSGTEVELDDLPDYPLMSSITEESPPVSRQPSRQGAVSPGPGSNMGRTPSRRSNPPVATRPASSASPKKKTSTMNDMDSVVRMPSRESGLRPPAGSKKRATTMNMDDKTSEAEPAASGINARPSSRAAQTPSKKKATSICNLPGDDQAQQQGEAEMPVTSGQPSKTAQKKIKQKAATISSMPGGDDPPSPRARRLSLIPAAQLERQLSFAEDSLDEVSASIREEEPELDWLEDFWNRVLVGSPTAECRGLSTRSISYWIGIFNRWQALGSWKPGQAPKVLDAYELQELLSIPMQKTLEWVKLFDPQAYTQLQATRSAMDHKKVKILVPAFLTCGIFLSTTISKKQKIRFLLGMFDEDDSQSIESPEFVEMISSFFCGIACAFGLLDYPHVVPKPSLRQKLGKHLFDRLLASTCCKLSFWEAKKVVSSGSVPFWIIEEWFQGDSGDPLFAPFAMFLERFSARGFEDDPEFFEDEERKFKLCHTSPVEPPLDTAAALDSSFLRRDQIGTVRDVFNECQKQLDFSHTHADIERALGATVPPDLWCNHLARGLEEMERTRQLGQKPSLALFLKKICPNAKPRHLRMFQFWMKELDHIEELKVQSASSRRMLQSFERFIAQPVLPARIRQELSEEYSHLDSSGREARVMADVLRKKFFARGSSVSKDDYIAAMCPIDFRPKEGNPATDQAVSQLLRMYVVRVEENLAQKEALFAKSSHAGAVSPRKRFIKPAVPERQWALWNNAFDAFSPSETGTGRVSISGLVHQHDICPAVCDFMCNIIARGSTEAHEPGFSKEVFLQKMLELSSWRVRKENLSQGRLCAV